MIQSEIHFLRYRVKAGNLYWKSGNNALKVISVPLEQQDPDDAGALDYVALIESQTGSTFHVALSNAELSDFYVLQPLSADVVIKPESHPGASYGSGTLPLNVNGITN